MHQHSPAFYRLRTAARAVFHTATVAAVLYVLHLPSLLTGPM